MKLPDILEPTPKIQIVKNGQTYEQAMKRLELGLVMDFIELLNDILARGQQEALKLFEKLLEQKLMNQQGFYLSVAMLGIKVTRTKTFQFLGKLLSLSDSEMEAQPVSIIPGLIAGITEHPDLEDFFAQLELLSPRLSEKLSTMSGKPSTSNSSVISSTQDSVTTTSEGSPTDG
jgi:hypothetical protein